MLLLIVILVFAAVGFRRWKAAGVAHLIAPPAGAAAPSFDSPKNERDVADRAGIIARSLRNDRGKPTVRIYAVPPGSPWLQARKVVATQLDHWEQIGDCADSIQATIVECAWREPTRWWPREVALTMLRLPPANGESTNWPSATFVIIGSSLGN